MAQKSENAFRPCKGLSFIDWDDLSEEEYQKLDRIINSSAGCSGVQLPFSADGDKAFVPPHFVNDAAFEPVIPAPAIVGFPIPVHWAHTEPVICPPAGTHYPITVPGGFVFPNPTQTASGETTMAFVPAISAVQPMYAVPGISGHHIPPRYQTDTPPQSEPVDLSLPVKRPSPELSNEPLTQDILPPATLTHPLPVTQGLGITPAVSHDLPICHLDMQHTHNTQAVYISHANTAQPVLATNECGSSAPENIRQDTVIQTPRSVAVTGLPPVQKPSLIEFGEPVVFVNSPAGDSKQFKSNYKANLANVDTVNGETVIEKNISTNVQVKPNQQTVRQDTNANDAALHPSSPYVATVASFVTTTDNTSDALGSNSNNPEEPHSMISNKDAASEPSTKQTPHPPVKMWSSLFESRNKSSGGSVTSGTIVSRSLGTVTVPVSNAVVTEEVKSVKYWQEQEKAEAKQISVLTDKVGPVAVKNDPLASKISEILFDLPVVHTPTVIQPRGLVNGSNTCFMNATLQVLMGCPPFVNMFRSFSNFPSRPGSHSSTPIFDSLVRFVNSFQECQRIRNQGSRGKKGAHMDIHFGQPFSPAPLLSVAQDILGLHIGVQHDAEEFLSQILMICHEELENVMKLHHVSGVNSNDKNHARNGFPEGVTKEVDNRDGDDDDVSWLRVGPKNHHVETNVNDCGQTPLSSIFAGLSRSCLMRESGKTSDTVDSFFTLKLDIQAENVHSLNDALLRLNTIETVHDADGGKVQGQRRMFFDVLPPVLIMHLKLFQYSNGNGQKIQKKIDFGVDLVIPKETLSRVGKTKLMSVKSRTYKLFGVVNHHGMKMNDGHYTSDVYLSVANGWLHFDDSEVTHIQESQVLQYSEHRMPYLLFYRRMDLSHPTGHS